MLGRGLSAAELRLRLIFLFRLLKVDNRGVLRPLGNYEE